MGPNDVRNIIVSMNPENVSLMRGPSCTSSLLAPVQSDVWVSDAYRIAGVVGHLFDTGSFISSDRARQPTSFECYSLTILFFLFPEPTWMTFQNRGLVWKSPSI